MKILLQASNVSYRASANDLSFIKNIRDKDVSVLESLQKQKIETLLKYREVKKVIELSQNMLDKYSNSQVSQDIIKIARRDLEDLKIFRDVLMAKLKEINLSILNEEEKNY